MSQGTIFSYLIVVKLEIQNRKK